MPPRLAEQQMHMLRHDHVPVNLESLKLRRTRSRPNSKMRRLSSATSSGACPEPHERSEGVEWGGGNSRM